MSAPRPCRVNVASPLREYTRGAGAVQASGRTVGELLADLDRRFPGMRFRMVDEQDRLRPHIRVFIGEQAAQDLSAPLPGGQVVHLVCALSGG